MIYDIMKSRRKLANAKDIERISIKPLFVLKAIITQKNKSLY